MYVVNVHKAKTELSQLLAMVETGEDVVIARHGKHVARLVRCKPNIKRQPDVLKGAIEIPDRLFDSLSKQELNAWIGDEP